MCKIIGASVLIDDNWNYVHEVWFIFIFAVTAQCIGTVEVPILFGIYGWNRREDPKDYENMICCKNWKEVVDVLMNHSFAWSVCEKTKDNDLEKGVNRIASLRP